LPDLPAAEEAQVKRPAHMTLVDADKFSALVSRCTELRERAEKAEARIEALEKENRILRANASKSVLRRLEDQGALAAEEKPLCDCVPGHLCELHADEEKNEPETFCPACDAGVGQCNGPHKGNAGEVPY